MCIVNFFADGDNDVVAWNSPRNLLIIAFEQTNLDPQGRPSGAYVGLMITTWLLLIHWETGSVGVVQGGKGGRMALQGPHT